MPFTLATKWKPLPNGTYEIRDPFDGGIDPRCPEAQHWYIPEHNYRMEVHNQQVVNPSPERVEELTGSAYYHHNGWGFPEDWLHLVEGGAV